MTESVADKPCTHPSVSVRIIETHNKSYKLTRNGYKLIDDVLDETDWGTAYFECDKCDAELTKNEFMEKY